MVAASHSTPGLHSPSKASRVPKPRCASNTCETQVPESIPLIDVTVSHSSSQVHPCPGHLVFSFFASGNSSQLMPSALQPFCYSCLVSSLMLYFEVVRSYPRRGKALAQHHPTPASRSLSPLLPLLRARLQPQSRDCHDLRPAVQLQVFSLPSHPDTPVVIYTFSPLRALSGQAMAGRLHNPFNLDSTASNCHH